MGPMSSSIKTVMGTLAASLAAGSLFLLSGCQTPPVDDESQMPWNTPQDWESSPMMPGYGNRY